MPQCLCCKLHSWLSLMLLLTRSRRLTSLAVISSVTRGRGRMQKMVTLSLTRGMNSETVGHGGVIIVALRCGESVVNCGGVSISHAPCLHCRVDLIDTISCSDGIDVILF